MLKKQEIGIVKKQDILENQVNRVYLSLGSNLGNRINNLEIAKYTLITEGVNILKSSSFYKTNSWPNKNFPYYLNIVLFAKTHLKLTELFEKVKYIEKIMGRKVDKKNYPRICDIDIIDFNGLCLKSKFKNHNIEVPHINMHKRNFVLMPLYEVDKSWFHPKIKKNVSYLLSKLSFKDLRAIKFN